MMQARSRLAGTTGTLDMLTSSGALNHTRLRRRPALDNRSDDTQRPDKRSTTHRDAAAALDAAPDATAPRNGQPNVHCSVKRPSQAPRRLVEPSEDGRPPRREHAPAKKRKLAAVPVNKEELARRAQVRIDLSWVAQVRLSAPGSNMEWGPVSGLASASCCGLYRIFAVVPPLQQVSHAAAADLCMRAAAGALGTAACQRQQHPG